MVRGCVLAIFRAVRFRVSAASRSFSLWTACWALALAAYLGRRVRGAAGRSFSSGSSIAREDARGFLGLDALAVLLRPALLELLLPGPLLVDLHAPPRLLGQARVRLHEVHEVVVGLGQPFQVDVVETAGRERLLLLRGRGRARFVARRRDEQRGHLWRARRPCRGSPTSRLWAACSGSR